MLKEKTWVLPPDITSLFFYESKFRNLKIKLEI